MVSKADHTMSYTVFLTYLKFSPTFGATSQIERGAAIGCSYRDKTEAGTHNHEYLVLRYTQATRHGSAHQLVQSCGRYLADHSAASSTDERSYFGCNTVTITAVAFSKAICGLS